MEILVVLAIVGSLVAIVLPVVSLAGRKSRQTECASNLRQLGMAALLYASDNDQRFPPYQNHEQENCNTTFEGGYCDAEALDTALESFVQARRVWFCPTDPVAGKQSTLWHVDHRYTSYRFVFSRTGCLNAVGMDCRDGSRRIVGHVSTLPIISDPNWGLGPVTSWGLGNLDGGHHFSGINVCYADGHVKWKRM